jgi:hypothetical protein
MKWAFMYTLDEPAGEPRIDTMGSLICVGVSSVSEAPSLAGLAAVVSAVQGRIPVGAVFFGVDASSGLNRLFSGCAS